MMNNNKSRNYQMDMTTGALLPKVLLYAVPLILTGILQLLYNAADMIVVGRFAGSESLAAVSSCGSLINLLTNLFIGLSVGTSVSVSHAFGAGRDDEIEAAVHTGITLSLIGGVLIGVLGIAAGRPLLQIMGSPENVIDLSTLYIRIFFAGMPANMLYIFGAAVLRAVGDTRRPLYYLAFSGIVNVVLNIVLVVLFSMDVAGVAIATITSQAISALLVTRCLMRSEGALQLCWKKLRIDRWQLNRVLRVGLPAGLQGSLFSISNVLIQSSVNSFGSLTMAGNGASSSIEGFVYVAMNALYQASITFTGQNMGAGKYRRVRRVTWTTQAAVFVTGLSVGMLFYAFGPRLLSLYNSDPEVIRLGMVRMSVIIPTYFLCGMMDTMVGTLRGMGYSIIPMICSLAGACALRILWIMTVFAANHTLFILYISYPISWGLTFLCHCLCYVYASHKLPREDAPLHREVTE